MINGSDKQLHRLRNNHNDWDDIPDARLSAQQRLAKRTNGYVTFANIITVTGFALVLVGLGQLLQKHYLAGAIYMFFGRWADMLDGFVANYTGTKGRVGRDADPIVDTLSLILGLPVLAYTHIIPIIAVLVLATPKLVGVTAAIAAKLRSITLVSTADGKVSTMSLWLGVGCFLTVAAFRGHLPGPGLFIFGALGWILTLTGAILSIPASHDYARVGFGPKQ